MKPILPLLLAFLSALPAAADDFGLWTDVAVQKNFSKKFSVNAALGFRAQDRLRQATRCDLSVGAEYSPLGWLSFGAGYTYIYGHKGEETKESYKSDGTFRGYNVDHDYWRSRHRANFDVAGKWNVGRFTFSVRERYQFTRYASASTTRDRYRNPINPANLGGYTGDTYECNGQHFASLEHTTDDKPAKSRHLLRSRFGVEYNIRHCAFTPYATFEFHNDLKESMNLDKSRLTVGTEWKITKQHRVDFAYIYQNSHDADDNDGGGLHAISVGYKFKF